MNEENFSSSVESTTGLSEPSSSQLAENDVQLHWQDVVKRRSFLKGISIAGATMAAGALMENSVRRRRAARASSRKAMRHSSDSRLQQS